MSRGLINTNRCFKRIIFENDLRPHSLNADFNLVYPTSLTAGKTFVLSPKF
jgi:hypothetical protein